MAVELRNDAATLRRKLYRRAVVDACVKLDPRRQVRNPVMFVTEVGALVVTVLAIQAIAQRAIPAVPFLEDEKFPFGRLFRDRPCDTVEAAHFISGRSEEDDLSTLFEIHLQRVCGRSAG